MFKLTNRQLKKRLTIEWEVEGHKESVIASTSVFSRDDYISQWKSSLELLLNFNVPAPIFLNLEINNNNLGRLWTLNLIPKAGPHSTIYITEQFIHITTDINHLKEKVPLIDSPKTPYDYSTLFFLDVGDVESIYPYLLYDPIGASCWTTSKEEILEILKLY